MSFSMIRWRVSLDRVMYYDGLSECAIPRWVSTPENCVWLQPVELNNHLLIVSTLENIPIEELEVEEVKYD